MTIMGFINEDNSRILPCKVSPGGVLKVFRSGPEKNNDINPYMTGTVNLSYVRQVDEIRLTNEGIGVLYQDGNVLGEVPLSFY